MVTRKKANVQAAALPQYLTDATSAVEAASANLAAVTAAVAVLPEAVKAAALAVAEAAHAEAVGTLALAAAQADVDMARQSDVSAAEAAALVIPEGMRAAALAAMLAVVEAKYAPLPPVVEDAPAVEAEAVSASAGKKPVGAKAAAINAAAAADPESVKRGFALLQVWDTELTRWQPRSSMARQGGTRYPSFVPLAGAGVANRAEHEARTADVRLYFNSIGQAGAGGESTATAAWLTRTGKSHGVGGSKHEDYGAKQFVTAAELALYPDGRFRLALPSQADVRFLRTDAAAMAAYLSGAAAAAPAAPISTTQAVSQPAAPTAPLVKADAATGALVALPPMANCSVCSTRNTVGALVCSICGSEDWNA